MKIVIFGAGYVGTVTGACLAKCGHSLTFIEPNQEKVKVINSGKSPILEPGLEELIQLGVQNGSIIAQTSPESSLQDADLAMIAVATPSSLNGTLQLDYLANVFTTLVNCTENRKEPLIVVIRSTVHPLALRKLQTIYQNANIVVVVNPEFLRESTAVHDFFNAPFSVAGGDNLEAVELVLSLYQKFSTKLFSLSFEAASLLKYACNAYHALKIAFANEISIICNSLNVNPLELMDVFCEDNILNCSKAYLKPGFSFGGSCLPKDLRTLNSLARDLGETFPLISSILPSNQLHFQRAFDRIIRGNHHSLAILGMSFKKNSDDLRESPFVELIENLIGKGIHIKIYDPDVMAERLTGSNLEFFNQRFKHLLPLLKSDINSTLINCDGLVLCKDLMDEKLLDQLQKNEIPIYDLQNHLLRRHKKTSLHGSEKMAC